MKCKSGKCHMLDMGKCKSRPTWNYNLRERGSNKETCIYSEESDLGRVIHDTLSLDENIKTIFGRKY